MSQVLVGIRVTLFVALAGIAILGVITVPASAATTADNASLGADISSFMQASSVETADDVEEGRFEVAMNRTDDPEERRALVEARRARLEEKSERLRTQRATLGESPDVRNRSIATRISVGAVGLERSVNATERRAQAADVPTERFSELRESARAVRDPDVVGLARGVDRPPNAGLPDETPPANRSGTPAPRDGGEQGPESPRPPAGTDAPTDARDANRDADRDANRDADRDGSPNADAAPGVDRDNDDGVGGTDAPAGVNGTTSPTGER